MKSLSLATRAGGLVLAVALLALASGRGPADVAAQTGPWVAPESEKAKKNPLPADKKTIEQGEKVAKINCVSCHGPAGQGQRPRRGRAEPQAGGLDVEAGAGRAGRGDLLEDHQRAGRHALVAAPARERPLGRRPIHPHARGEVTAPPSSRRP